MKGKLKWKEIWKMKINRKNGRKYSGKIEKENHSERKGYEEKEKKYCKCVSKIRCLFNHRICIIVT